MTFVAPLLGFPSVPLPAAPAVFCGVSCRRFPLEVTLPFWLKMPVLLMRWSYVCGGCGIFVRGLFSLVPYSSSASCGLRSFPAAGYPQGFLPFLATSACPTAALVVCVGLPPCSGVLRTSPTLAALPMFAGFCALCQGAPTVVVTALVPTVWWCLVAPRAFRALLVVLSSPPAVLSLCGGLCYVHCLFSLALGWGCSWPAVSAAHVSCEVGAVAAALHGSSSF